MKTLTLLLLSIVSLNSTGHAAQVKLDSMYLDINNCVNLESDPELEGYVKQECESIGGVRIFKEMGDNRVWLSFQRPQDKSAKRIADLGAGNTAMPYLKGTKIEFRFYVEKNQMVPVGVVYRIQGTDMSNETNPDATTQNLIVASFVGKKVKLVATIDGKSRRANQAAREALDKVVNH